MKSLNICLILGLLIAGCATSPTGRSQFTMMPDGMLDKMGVQSYENLKKDAKINTDQKVNRYVQCIVNDLIPVIPEKYRQVNWEVTVFVDDTANAFALPGGKIGVNTGMLKVATTQNELAAVIGHEIAHVIARHSNERASSQFATAAAVNIVAAGSGDHNAQIAAALGTGAYYGIQLPFSRTQESEADIMGLEYMAKAGFNPQASVDLWKKMDAKSGSRPPEFLLTHPSSQTRIKRLEENMSEALFLYKASKHKPACRL